MKKRKSRKTKRTKFNVVVGMNIAKIRKAKLFSQALMGEMLDVHQSAVSRIERGEQKLTFEGAVKFATSVQISVYDLARAQEDE
jgi:transcriptional regulator with XRE-family HTH domain